MGKDFGHNVWQKVCSNELLRCIKLSGSYRQKAWNTSRRYFQVIINLNTKNLKDEPSRIIIADLDFTKSDLSNFDLSYCYIIRCNFSNATLENTDFTRSIIKECNFDKANVSGTVFSHASLGNDVLNFDKAITNTSTKMNLNTSELPIGLPRYMVDLVHADKRRYESNRKTSLIERFWLKYTNYGRDIFPVFSMIATLYVAGGLANFIFMFDGNVKNWREIAVKSMFLSSEALIGIDPSVPITTDIWRLVFNLQSAISLIIMALLIATLTYKTTSPAADV